MRARLSAVALVAVVAVGACTTEQVAGNTGDAAKLVGRVAVNTTVGATKLAYRGARGNIPRGTGSAQPRGRAVSAGHVPVQRR